MVQAGQSGTWGAGTKAPVGVVAGLVSGLLALVALFAPGAAPAHAASSAALTLSASNGFRIDVLSEGGEVTVIASERRPPVATFSPDGRPHRGAAANGAASIYYARAAAPSPSRIEASLGGLGRISLRFHPSGGVRVTELGQGSAVCRRPGRVVRRLGTFSGVVEFRGEQGYTWARATRARGSVGTPLPPGCASGAAGEASASRIPPRPRGALLAVVDSRAGTGFEARTTPMGVAFVATLRERLEGGLVVVRRAFAGAPRSSFSFDPSFSSATVRPPSPFSGFARYEAGASHRVGSWSGNLAVTFPGATLPMTGPGFRASLRAHR